MRKLENRYFARFFLLVLRSVKNNIINSHCESPPWRGRSNLKSLFTKRLHGRVLGLRRSTPGNDKNTSVNLANVTLIAAVLLAILTSGCGSPVKNEEPAEPETPIIEKDTMVRMHRAFDHFSKAGLYEISGNFERAADEYRLALYYDPTSMELKRSLANVNFQLKRYGEVLDFIEKLDHPTIDDLILAANCHRLNGNLDKAAEYFIRVSDMDSTLDFPGLQQKQRCLASGTGLVLYKNRQV